MKALQLLLVFILCIKCNTKIPEHIISEIDKLPDKIDYNYDVKPILSDRCYQCHGPDEKTRKAGLRLDIEKIAFSRLQSGNKAFSKGNIHRSESVNRILNDDDEIKMPPPESNLSLTAKEKAILIKWIDQGAEWKNHWSFIPPKNNLDHVFEEKENPIDFYIAKKHLENGLAFSQPASKEKLVRRIYFDLTGLPPTIEQIDSFINDSSEDAFDKLVDELLLTDAHAERMALEWMDLSRYADSHGLHADGARTMWPWRDWVIKAFKKNMPYDQFVTWQLAGDLLPEATREQKLATAFNRNSPMTAEGGVIDEEWRLNYVFDRTETMSTAFLGLTVACAKCHDHKFDPISQKDYYQMTAFFNNVRELGMTGDDGDFGPLLYLPTKKQESQLGKLEKSLKISQQKIKIAENQLEELYEYIDNLKIKENLDLNLIGNYPFDKVTRLNTKTRVGTFNQNFDRNKLFVADDNKNVRSLHAPNVVEGINGNALEFKTDFDNLAISNEIPHFEWTEEFSVSIWAQTYEKKEDKRQFILGTTGDKNNWWRGWDFYLDGENRVNFRLINIAPGNMIHVRSKKSIDINEWYHLAFSYDGTGKAEGIKIFKNGALFKFDVEIDNLSKSIKPVTWSGVRLDNRPILLGKTYATMGGENGLFVGKMDDLKIYNKALSDLEIETLYKKDSKKNDKFSEDLFKDHWVKNHPKYSYLKKEYLKNLESWRKAIEPVLEVMVMEELDEPRTTYLYNRGEYNQPSITVDAKTPNILPEMDESLPKNRLGLAKWLFKKDNPLTARVAVNRYWQLIFGNGLVTTPTDFGVQGALPSHPQLLDWLSIYFMESDWNVRDLIKKMVKSKTYKQTSNSSKELLEKDPNNILLARSNRFRLPAEMIRDNALATSSLLVTDVGGESVKPYQPDGLWEEKSNFSFDLLKYKTTKGDSLYRRGLYTFIRRTSPPPSMIAFDASTREVCTIKRESTSTPLQALVLLNDIQFFEASRVMAERIQNEGGKTIEDQIKYGFRLATSRYPNIEEIKVLKDLYVSQLNHYKKFPNAAMKAILVGEKPINLKFDPIKTAALTILTNTLLNHNETFVKY